MANLRTGGKVTVPEDFFNSLLKAELKADNRALSDRLDRVLESLLAAKP